MCGIIGYIGQEDACNIVYQGLKNLEYRGYDSWGMAYVLNSKIQSIKKLGKITESEEHLPKTKICIGHSRWSTHGAVTLDNAHPHFSEDGNIALIHNGIIENYIELKKQLEEKGYKFSSETDTETVAHLIEDNLKQEKEFKQAVIDSVRQLKGSFALVIINKNENKIIAVRKDSPLVVGIDGNNYFAASDFTAFLKTTQNVVFLDNKEMAILGDNLEFYNYKTGEKIEKKIEKIGWNSESVEKGNYKHFMLKEIMEQSSSMKKTIESLIDGDKIKLGVLNGDDKINRIVILACGTSWHAGLVGEFLIEKLAGISVEVEYASEFRYRDPVLDENTLCIAISQSGETADTLAAIKEAKSRGSHVIGIVNVKGSSITRECEGVIYTEAGPEIGVASTKAFTTQLAVLFLLAVHLGVKRGKLSKERTKDLIDEIKRIPAKMDQVLGSDDWIEECTKKYYEKENALFLGRGVNYPIALEGALKLKEISYIHAEGYPAAEMKHGPIALIDENMPVVFLALKDSSYQKILGNIQEVKSRKGKIIVIATKADNDIEQFADTVIYIPPTDDLLVPFLSVIPLQLLAYHIADKRGCDIDKPRNLAKSVTVE